MPVTVEINGKSVTLTVRHEAVDENFALLYVTATVGTASFEFVACQFIPCGDIETRNYRGFDDAKYDDVDGLIAALDIECSDEDDDAEDAVFEIIHDALSDEYDRLSEEDTEAVCCDREMVADDNYPARQVAAIGTEEWKFCPGCGRGRREITGVPTYDRAVSNGVTFHDFDGCDNPEVKLTHNPLTSRGLKRIRKEHAA